MELILVSYMMTIGIKYGPELCLQTMFDGHPRKLRRPTTQLLQSLPGRLLKLWKEHGHARHGIYHGNVDHEGIFRTSPISENLIDS